MQKISVIVPVYKVEKYLNRCVDSILNQTFTDFELILVDDGSPDNCGKMCDEYAEKDGRVVVIHKKNGGLSDARNAGIDWTFANSGSEWITFIDSDDWVHEKYLEVLYKSVIDADCKISVCGYIRTNGEQPNIIEKEMQLVSPEDLWVNNKINAVVAWGKIYHKNCWENIRYPLGVIHEDEFTTYKILFKNAQLAYVPSPLYYYFLNPNGIMSEEWTPKRLLQSQVSYEQYVFFHEHNFQRAALCSLQLYYYFLGENIKANQQNGNVKWVRRLRKELRRSLRQHTKECRKNHVNIRWCYYIAYPVFYNIVFSIIRFFKKK